MMSKDKLRYYLKSSMDHAQSAMNNQAAGSLGLAASGAYGACDESIHDLREALALPPSRTDTETK